MEAKVIDVSARGARSFAAFSPRRSPFWIALFLGAALRFYCVVFTEGTYDINDWTKHAIGVRDHGLIGYYHANEWANHPPFISKVASLILRASEAMGIPFRITFRAPFALIDAGTVCLREGPCLVFYPQDAVARVQRSRQVEEVRREDRWLIGGRCCL